MPRNRKYFPHNAVLFITTRTEEGLPIVSSYVNNFIILGILAKARKMYRVRICHFLFMANHLHMILVVDSPQDVSNFMCYLKGEISHAINRLLGRRQKTIWQDGYDSPIILTPDKVKSYIKYLYQNPSKAGLVHSIDEYPGVSSWEMFKRNQYSKEYSKLSRDLIPCLSTPDLGINEQKRIVEDFNKLQLPKYNLILEPNAWRESLGCNHASLSDEQIIAEIKQEEETLKSNRIKKNKTILGSTALRRESMTKEYAPKKYTRRMICLCSDLCLRKAFVETFKFLSSLAEKAYRAWKSGDFSLSIPPSMFCPRRPEFASAIGLY